MPGVTDTCCGYSGGLKPKPTYRNIKDHTEAVMVTFDPTKISYEKLLNHVFLSTNVHSAPPALEGCRHGARQYISAVWPNGPEQKAALQRKIEAVEKQRGKKVLMCTDPLKTFWYAEQYHQQYSFQGNEKQRARAEAYARAHP